jgi:hypothetical protein
LLEILRKERRSFQSEQTGSLVAILCLIGKTAALAQDLLVIKALTE